METVTSDDDTQITFERNGDGPPLVLLHGSSATHDSFRALVPELAEEFTVIAPDRRGRGESGDADEYDLEREVADLEAVVDAIDGEPIVVGHSFGGLVALRAAIEDVPMANLVLYEPSILVGEHSDADLADRMAERLDAGDRREAMKLFFVEGGGMPEPERLPFWPAEVNFDLTETVVRENYAVEGFELPANPAVNVPTLLLTGERGPEHLRDGVHTLEDRLPQSELVELDGVGHMAVSSAPDRVAAAIRTFVQSG